jgi:hypothetical protein
MNARASRYYINTPEEEAEIQRGIELDPDTIDLSDESIPLTPFKFCGLDPKLFLTKSDSC